MTSEPTIVLDASALLAFVLMEPGDDEVQKALEARAAIGAVNFAEVLSKLSDRGQSVDRSLAVLGARGLLTTSLRIVPLDDSQAIEVARLRAIVRPLGLSLADRACLALARTSGLPVLTADRAWTALDLGIEIRAIR